MAVRHKRATMGTASVEHSQVIVKAYDDQINVHNECILRHSIFKFVKFLYRNFFHCLIFLIGLDIDDKQYHGSALNQTTGEILEFKCRPNLKGLLGRLEKLLKYFPGSTFKLFYEASYIGYTLMPGQF